ncbi:MAG: T9SS type A sorting domain-containing protein [Ignavibacteria bacterium]|nr:T9SS type A sorting domain-containing protein [Ignavibacteria bacterium]
MAGVYITTNNGTSWVEVNNGLTNNFVYSLAITGTNLFAGTFGGGVWRRPLSEIISVQSLSTEVPEQFSLSQNYPNPFNPTNIEFSLPEKSFVKLKVFDIAGKEVAELVNENLSAGTFKYEFNAENLREDCIFINLRQKSFQRRRG